MNKICISIITILSLLLIGILVFEYSSEIFEAEKSQFESIQNYTLVSGDDEIYRKIDSDIQPLLKKQFGDIKLDKNLLIKDDDSYHMFYFSEHVPRLVNVIDIVLPQIQALGYSESNSPDSRTYSYNFTIAGKKYLMIFHVLSYMLEDEDDDHGENMGIYMIYVKKL